MLNLFKYIDELENRIRIIEEELLRYDFGYDPVETLAKKLKEKESEGGTKLWKDKFAMNKPDNPANKPLTPEETRKQWLIDKDGKYGYADTLDKVNNLWDPKT